MIKLLALLRFLIGWTKPQQIPPKRRTPEYRPRFGDVDVRERPTRSEPPSIDPFCEWLISLTGEKRLRALRLLREGYFGGNLNLVTA